MTAVRGGASAVDLTPHLDAVPDRTVERIRAAHSIMAVGHENPDGDALGASLAIRTIAHELGARADVVMSDPPPPLYDYLAGIETVRTDPDPAAEYDLVVTSDCATIDRIGEVRNRHADLFARLPLVVIDHHISNDAAGLDDWIEPHAAATCEMVALLALRLGVPLTAGDGALAAALATGIVMDTGTFGHPNATPRTFAVTAALVEAGAPLSEISRRLYRSKPEAQLRLFGRVLDRLETDLDGRVVWSTLTPADIDGSGAIDAHSEGIIDLLTQAEHAEVAILFKANGNGTTKISVRTKPGGVDGTVLTGRFGGGGHARAAGATIAGGLGEAIPAVLAEARRLAAEVIR